MRIIIFYVAFVVVGEMGTYFIGRAVEHWSETASLPAFLACFFFVLLAAWKLAVMVTEPKTV